MSEKRTVTFVLRFEQKDTPSWLWDIHGGGKPLSGLQVLSIAEGDVVRERDELEVRLDAFENNGDK